MALNLGGPQPPAETRGDLTYIQGKPDPNRPQGQLVASIADVVDAAIERDGSELVLTATTAAPVPRQLKISALEFRWDLTGEDGSTWTVAVSIDKTTEATVFSDEGFGAGTVDQTLPGSVSVRDDVVEVLIDNSQIPGFPSTFEWSLATTLRAFKDEPDSPRAEDRFPDEGIARFGG